MKREYPIWRAGVSDSDTEASGTRHNSAAEAVACGSTFRDLAGNAATFWAAVATSTCQTHLPVGLIGSCSFGPPRGSGLQPDFPCLPPQAHQRQRRLSISDSICVCRGSLTPYCCQGGRARRTLEGAARQAFGTCVRAGNLQRGAQTLKSEGTVRDILFPGEPENVSQCLGPQSIDEASSIFLSASALPAHL